MFDEIGCFHLIAIFETEREWVFILNGCKKPNVPNLNDRTYLKLIGCKTTNIEVVETTCGVPFASILKNNDEINIGADGYTYFLRKIN